MTSKKESLAVSPGESTELTRGSGQGAERFARRRVTTPVVDILEREEGILIRADLPGVKSDGVEVVVDRDVLTLRGRNASEAPTGLQAIYREYEPVDYERTFLLGRDVDRDAIEARVQWGVLEVFLPRETAARARKINVRPA